MKNIRVKHIAILLLFLLLIGSYVLIYLYPIDVNARVASIPEISLRIFAAIGSLFLLAITISYLTDNWNNRIFNN